MTSQTIFMNFENVANVGSSSRVHSYKMYVAKKWQTFARLRPTECHFSSKLRWFQSEVPFKQEEKGILHLSF